MNHQYQEKPIPLITVDQNSGKYILTDDGRDFIKSVPGPIGVVSVAGLYRTGKSYLLNRMILNRSSGFGVGPTVNPCTKGLWCWGTPIKGQSPEGQKINIIVIDTQGIGALDEDQTHDTRIFTLAILASSCFIYNSTGSIDQNAVQNLSLVVNLTKHIQLSTQSKNEEEDLDKIASYFPKFYWVVRDFSLQMVDQQGNPMNSKEYLQKALAPQKGNSDDIEEKNRIRRILTSFFKQRQCITLVRPLIDQTKLQQLDGLDFDQLRPQFVKKVMELRRNIANKMKPKTLNNQKLNGDLYWSMLTSYVGAINDGAVPNIQNAWHYMCQEQCTKIINQSYEVFEKMIRDIKIPCALEQMDNDLEIAREAAVDYFKKQSIGEETDQYYRELLKKMKDRSHKLKTVNAEDGKQAFKKYLSPFMNQIKQKVNCGKYENIEEFITEIGTLQEKIIKQQPKFVDWKLHLNFILKKMLELGSKFLMKKEKNEREQLKKKTEQISKLNQIEIEKLKNQKQGNYTNLMTQIKQLEKEKVELTFKLECFQSDLKETTREKTDQVQKLNKSLFSKKKIIEEKQNQLDRRVTEANQRVQQVERALQQKQSDWDKEKAVMQKQLQQNQELIQEIQKKKHITQTKYEVQRSQVSQKHGEELMNERHKVEELTQKYLSMKQDNEQFDNNVRNLSERVRELTQKSEADQKKFKEQLQKRRRQIEKLESERQFQMGQFKDHIEQQKDQLSNNKKQLEELLKKNELRLREEKNEFEMKNTKMQHQLLLLRQEYSQLSVKNQENEVKISEMKKRHDEEREAWEIDRGLFQQEQVAKKISQMTIQYTTQVQILKKTQEKDGEKYTNQITQFTESINRYQLDMKLLKEQLMNQQQQKNELEEKKNKQVEKLEHRIKNMQKEHKNAIHDKEKQLYEKLDRKERQLNEEKDNYQFSKGQYEGKLGTEMTILKNLHELQKQKLEAKSLQQREKSKKVIRQLKNSHEKTMEELKDTYQEEMEERISLYENQIKSFEVTIIDLKSQKEGISRERNNFENKLRELTIQSTKREQNLTEQLERLNQLTKSQKETLMKRIDEMQLTKNSIERQLLSIKHTKSQLISQKQKQQSEIEELKAENSRVKESYESYKINSEIKIKNITDTYMNYKTEKQTELALFGQEKKYLEQKNRELERQKQMKQNYYENEIKRQKDELQNEKRRTEEKFSTQKKLYEDKIERLKKQRLESEEHLHKKISFNEKQQAVLQQKIKNLQANLMESQSKYKIEVNSLKQDLNIQKQSRKSENIESQAIIKQIQQKITTQETSYNKLRNDSDLAGRLAQNKYQNFFEKSEKQKYELLQKNSSLQKSLQDIKKRSDNDKSSQESTYQQLRSKLQLKYRDQNTALKESLREKNRELETLNKQKQRQIKDLNEKYAFLNQEKTSLEKKIQRLEEQSSENERTLNFTIDTLKEQMIQIQMTLKRQIDAVSQQHKQKYQEIQRKNKIVEEAKQMIMFEKEKEQVKWSMQKTSYEEKVNELRDEFDRVQRDNGKLMKDNEKYKADKKKNTSQIRDRTFIYARDIPNENKENNPQQ